MFTANTSLIIPTKDRYKLLETTLKFIKDSKLKFREIIIIDSSKNKVPIKNLSKKYKTKLYFSVASTSLQRNIGIKKTQNSKFVMFLDDDIFFYKNAFIEMNKFIKQNYRATGFAFNIIDKKYKKFNLFSNILNLIGIYPNNAGRVSSSGWHSQLFNLQEDIETQWLYSGATIFRKREIYNLKFNTFFNQSYCYLEDLDFSYYLYKKGKKLLVSSKAKISLPVQEQRNSFSFGLTETRNRKYFVKKYNLNILLFYLSAFVRILLKIRIQNWKQIFGNFYGLFK